MTDREYFEQEYILDDRQYLKYCDDPIECYFLEKELAYSDDTWLFNKPSDGLEDRYDEDSMPQRFSKRSRTL